MVFEKLVGGRLRYMSSGTCLGAINWPIWPVRCLSVGLAGLLIVTVLAACGSSSEAATSSERLKADVAFDRRGLDRRWEAPAEDPAQCEAEFVKAGQIPLETGSIKHVVAKKEDDTSRRAQVRKEAIERGEDVTEIDEMEGADTIELDISLYIPEHLDDAVIACQTLADWKAAGEAVPQPLAGREPMAFLMDRCKWSAKFAPARLDSIQTAICVELLGEDAYKID